MALRNKILNHLEESYPNFVHKGEIGRKAVNEWGFENENAGRRCRELFTEGLVERKYVNGEVMYRYKMFNEVREVKQEQKLIPVDYRTANGYVK